MTISSGILVYRDKKDKLEYLLVHPSGPFYKNKNIGAWTIPKGIIKEGESKLSAAKREFKEEMGQEIKGKLTYLGQIKLRKSKESIAYFAKGDIDETSIKSNTFEMEYPKNSGQLHTFPEIDEAKWLDYDNAIKLIHPKLILFLNKLNEKIKLM